MCPECGNDHISIEEFDFGICPQTGYHDAGERFRCGACGATGDATDVCQPTTVETFGSFPAENAGALRDCTIPPASREKRGSQHRLSHGVIVGAAAAGIEG
jgi:rubredoxin